MSSKDGLERDVRQEFIGTVQNGANRFFIKVVAIAVISTENRGNKKVGRIFLGEATLPLLLGKDKDYYFSDPCSNYLCIAFLVLTHVCL